MAWAAFAFLSHACAAKPEGCLLSGKVVFRGMGVEGARVQVLRQESGEWRDWEVWWSAYHGSFAGRVPEGRYRLKGSHLLPQGAGRYLRLEGLIAELEVVSTRRRINQLVLLLRVLPPVP